MDTKIEDSNLAFIGSDEDKAAREVSVPTEEEGQMKCCMIFCRGELLDHPNAIHDFD